MPYKSLDARRKVARESAARRWRKADPAFRWYSLTASRRHVHKVAEWVLQEKAKCGCALCGYRENADALELDHIVPRRLSGEKAVMINSFNSVRAAFKNPNIQVLCANCHAIKSVGERRVPITLDPS